MNQEKIKELFADEAFVKELFSKETPEEVQKIFAEHDVDVSVEELMKAREIILKKMEQGVENLELTEEELEEVSGGCAGMIAFFIVGGLLMSVPVVNTLTYGRW